MPSHLHPWPDERIRSFRRALLEFFQKRQRDLPWRDAPWRDTPTPYGTLVSEIMLQQTRVETVVPYYLRWMERFPDPETLAAADEEEVLRMWQGLGYYSRARNLLKTVREIVDTHGGELPRERAELEGLPGVGPYTAGAVASIAFGEPEPAVDGNVRRVLARLMDESAPTPGTLEVWARGLVDPDRPGDFNQALMELGAMVCTPRSPACGACPVSIHCEALVQGTVEQRPAPKVPRAIPRFVEAVAVVARFPTLRMPTARKPGGPKTGPEVLLSRRPATGLLARMWGCPTREVTGGTDPARVAWELAGELLADEIANRRDVPGPVTGESSWRERTDGPESHAELPKVEHVFSHRKVTYRPYRFLVEGSGAPFRDDPDLRWVAFGELGRIPLPVAQLRILSAAAASLGLEAPVDGKPGREGEGEDSARGANEDPAP